MRKISILGVEYDYEITTNKEDAGLCNADGYCDPFQKRIAIEDDFNEKDPGSTKNLGALKAKIKRHEVVHAFLFESGLNDYARDEKIVEWIAWQFPKLLETFKEIEVI